MMLVKNQTTIQCFRNSKLASMPVRTALQTAPKSMVRQFQVLHEGLSQRLYGLYWVWVSRTG